MKLTRFLSSAAALSLAAFFLGLTFDRYAVGFFALSATLMILMVAAQDYLRRSRSLSFAGTGITVTAAIRRSEKHPLAA